MWKAKLFNRLFGWDYVAYCRKGLYNKTHIARLYKNGGGKPYFITRDSSFEKTLHFLTYEDRKQIAFITFHPGKYFSEEVLEEMGLTDPS